MEVVIGLVGITVLLVVVIAVVLLWAVRSGQFEDLEGPAWRVVMDDDRPRIDDAAPHDAGEKPGDGNGKAEGP